MRDAAKVERIIQSALQKHEEKICNIIEMKMANIIGQEVSKQRENFQSASQLQSALEEENFD
jgi:hypothetical protein